MFKMGTIPYDDIEVAFFHKREKNDSKLLQQTFSFDLEKRNISELNGIKE